MTTDTNVPIGALQFDEILRAEVAAINQRRALLGRGALAAEGGGDKRQVLDAVGLALSGGGVRSAAFSLGVLQAFNHNNVLRSVDYISTVSGGGYIGSSLTATMTCTEGQFVFGSPPKQKLAASEISDTAAVGHLRNYSNYLIPAGGRDLVTGIAIIIRGLVANLALVLPVVLLVAAVTVLTNPNRADLGCPDLLGYPLCQTFPSWTKNFDLTLAALLLGVLLFFLWALYRSFAAPDRAAEFRTRLPMLASAYLVFLAVIFFIELQTFFIAGMFDLKDALDAKDAVSFEWLTGGLTTIAALLTPVAAMVTLFRQQIGDVLKATKVTARLSTRVAAALGKVVFWMAGAALPLVIWVAYLYLSYWGIINDKASIAKAFAITEFAMPATIGEAQPRSYCDSRAPTEEDFRAPGGLHTPRWMIRSAAWLTFSVFCPVFEPVSEQGRVIKWAFDRILIRPMVLFYGSIGLLLLILSRFLRPNANSLHRLYRDRLSKAFLFDPRPPGSEQPAVRRNEPSVDQGRDFPQLDRLLLSKLSTRHAPYHLINAALNIQGSDYANRRGRNADFFLFSPCYVGSDATGYALTAVFEKTTPSLDLATAVAISGAAASSNMGSASIRPLRPTLALLNVRLGYWLRNPRYTNGRAQSNGSLRQRLNNLRKALTPYLWSEISGRLYENSNDVYLTDGGHIENLGVYELLKRRCKLIVVVDAEADFAMHFPSFVTLQRYARIDLGALIEMPWGKIQTTTCALMGTGAGQPPLPTPSNGPHAAIGHVDYGGGEGGFLLYIKSSVTGDENDYVRDYGRRYNSFPHETTGDQFFSEEQFEVYRSLGFHAANCLLSGRDGIEVVGSDRLLTIKDENAAVTAVRTALLCAPKM